MATWNHPQLSSTLTPQVVAGEEWFYSRKIKKGGIPVKNPCLLLLCLPSSATFLTVSLSAAPPSLSGGGSQKWFGLGGKVLHNF